MRLVSSRAPRAAVLPLVLLLPLALPTARAHAQADSAARVDSVFARFARADGPGCAVGVSRAGRPILERAYGRAHLEHDAANTPATIFEAGSVSKQVTAAAVVLLAQRGTLSLDDDVRRWVPELPDYGRRITLRHLLNHTSGLRDWGTVVAAAGWPRGTRVHTHAQVLDVVARQRALNFPPGSEYLYSNTGYNLLAIIVERASGVPFAEFTRRELFEPLGMRHTSWRDDYTRVVPGRATAYAREDGEWRQDMPFENVHGNGGLLTTVGDLLIWNANLDRPTVGGAALVAELERQGRLTDGRTIAYAGGLVVNSYRGVREVAHSGATAGYRAYLARYPEQVLGVAVLCNAATANATALAHGVADVFLDVPPMPAPVAAALDSTVLRGTAGLYRVAHTGEPVEIVLVGDTLRVGGTPLVPRTGTEMTYGGRRVRVERDAHGRARRLHLVGPSDSLALERVEPWSPSPAELAAFVGTYRSDEAEVEYRVAVEGDSLVLLRRPDARFPLAPRYADAFEARMGLIRFSRDDAGRVTAMHLGLGRVRDLRFEKVR